MTTTTLAIGRIGIWATKWELGRMQSPSTENTRNWDRQALVPSPIEPSSKLIMDSNAKPVHPKQPPRIKQENNDTDCEKAAQVIVKPPAATKSDESSLDDMDLMLLHEDFPKLLALSAQVKELRNTLVNPPASQKTVSSALSPKEIEGAVARMQHELLRFPQQARQSVMRGKYPMTDFTIDDSVKTLEKELTHLKKFVHAHEGENVTLVNVTSSSKGKKGGKSKKEAIALKYAKWQTDILMNWMIEHLEEPFPDQAETQKLMDQTGLSQSQVVNWTTNVRKRNRKATCQGGKKPHHFIDFLFLVQDRENRRKHKGVEIDGHTKNEDHGSPLPTKTDPTSALPFVSPCDVSSLDVASSSYFMHGSNQPRPTHFSDIHHPGASTSSFMKDPSSDTEASSLDPLSIDDTNHNENLMLDFAEMWLVPKTGGILPTVTEDSYEVNPCSPLRKRNRAPSFDIQELDDDELNSWASEMGFDL